MTVTVEHIKRLWGRAGGKCAWCEAELSMYLNTLDLKELEGTLAKLVSLISRRVPKDALYTYDNLIIVCSDHRRELNHGMVDYPPEQILYMKIRHEDNIKFRHDALVIHNRLDLLNEIQHLFNENQWLMDHYGPHSPQAKQHAGNPAYQLAWDLRKVALIVPNNYTVVKLAEKWKTVFLKEAEGVLADRFRQYAWAYEEYAYGKRPANEVPAFPVDFLAFAQDVVPHA